MLPGPDIFYECPECKTRVYTPSLLSGNTFGADFFSDGKCYAPMLPEYPILTRCRNCHFIFWFEHQTPVAEFELGQTRPPEFEQILQAEMPDLPVYIEVIENSLFSSEPEEIYIRKKIHQEVNDFIRWGQEQELKDELHVYWMENSRKLLKLLENNSLIDLILLKAELYRNLGEFEKSLEILLTIQDEHYKDVVEQMKNECHKENRQVFLLKSE